MSFTKLTKSQYQQWLTDLRSGEFKQGSSNLCREDKYCCLGVLNHRLDKPFDSSSSYLYNRGDVPNDTEYFLIEQHIQIALASINDDSIIEKSEELAFYMGKALERRADISLSEEVREYYAECINKNAFSGIADFIEYLHDNKYYEFYEKIN